MTVVTVITVIVVTDRRILDKQIRDTIKQFMQVSNTVAWAEHSGDLTKAITDGKRIIVTTIEKFPYIVPQIGAEHKSNHFAIIIDEAHSGQSGRNSAQMNLALSGLASDDEMYDLVAIIDGYQVFSGDDVERLVNLYLDGADRDKLDPTLDACTAVYKQLETDDQIKFKSAAKSFVRTYGFLGAILPYGNADWERLSIFLNLLIPKLPSPREDDLSQGILETIDLESYRNEAREVMSIKLEESDTEVEPVPAGKVGHIVEPEMDLLSVILSNFNDMFGNINWNDADNVRRQILEIPAMVSKDEKYQNAMRNSDEQSARLESERALQQVIFAIMADNMELFKQFQDNPSFKKWLSDLVFNLTYNKEGKPYEMPGNGVHAKGN